LKNVNTKPTTAPEPASQGRVAQRNRTRRAIVEAAMRLLAAGTAPSMAEVAEAAEVSRRTVYMYFPTLEHLLIDATLGALSQNTIDSVVKESASHDPAVRAEQLSHVLNSHFAETIHLGRALIRLTVEEDAPAPGVPRRGYRRVQWIERALAPAREELTAREFERLVSALSVLMGWEPIIVLNDIRCLDQKQADEVLTFAVRAVVEKALNEARLRRKSRSGQA
jgi:AcrR family transcriptional regulator